MKVNGVIDGDYSKSEGRPQVNEMALAFGVYTPLGFYAIFGS